LRKSLTPQARRFVEMKHISGYSRKPDSTEHSGWQKENKLGGREEFLPLLLSTTNKVGTLPREFHNPDWLSSIGFSFILCKTMPFKLSAFALVSPGILTLFPENPTISTCHDCRLPIRNPKTFCSC